jgi:hypothetical protein
MRRRTLCSLAAITLTHLLPAQQPGETAPPAATFGTTVVLAAGLRGTVYFIPKDTMVLPDFEDNRVQRAGEVWTDMLNVPPSHWRSGFPGLTERFEWFAIDYNGRFWIDKPGRYLFALVSDDGSRLFLDGTPVVDNDCQHAPDLRLAAVKLDGGGHRLRVSYFQGPRDCVALVLAIAGPDQHWKVFSTNDFKAPSNPENWHYPAANAVTLLATNPEEASLTLNDLLRRLGEPGAGNKLVLKSRERKACMAQPIRSCGK